MKKALMRIDAQNALILLLLGDSDSLEVGDWMLAIGNPFGLGNMVTANNIIVKLGYFFRI